MTVVASVERKELRLLRGEVCAHPDLILGHGKMNHSATLVCEKRILAFGVRFNGFAPCLVLNDGVMNSLGHLGFDFTGCDCDTINEERQIDGVLALSLIMNLTHNAKDIVLVVVLCDRVARVVRISPSASDVLEACHRETVAKHLNGALLRLLQVLDQVALEVLAPVVRRLLLHSL